MAVLSPQAHHAGIWDWVKQVCRPLIISDIDPTHNYLATKLPTFQTSIYARTFKRERHDIKLFALKNGLSLVKEFVITADGDTQEVLRERDFNKLDELVGWISIWKK